jgi:hypothetical protein
MVNAYDNCCPIGSLIDMLQEDLNRRSKITLIDTSTYGTTVDGSEELKKSSMTLSGKHHTIKLAKFPQILL